MRYLSGVLLAFYYAVLCGLAVYGLHRLFLVLARPRRRPTPLSGSIPSTVVTVQLPVYNEVYVLDRLVEAACSIRHPRHLLEIQILDDSDDSTAARARGLAEAWRGKGFDVSWIHRGSRAGFKAGALGEGLARARGELIAIFDADFVPPPDFLERTLPHFRDPEVGMVQARWGHLNRGYSLLTRSQALLLDGHFVVEQEARAATGRYFNFNGTAGVFRRKCIEDAGGWQADTLTEDLDLSYRAQMKGWRFVLVNDVVCPGELPVEMNALRSQQHRWAKGSMQTAMKVLPALLGSLSAPRVKVEAVLHLTNNAAYLLLFLASVLLLPSLAARRGLGWGFALPDLIVFLAGTGSFGVFCAVSQKERRLGTLAALAEFPAVMALGAGFALNNALAVVEALAGRPSEFARTPKHRFGEDSPRWEALLYHGKTNYLAAVEAVMAIAFMAAIGWAAREGLYASLPFLALFASGYGYVSAITLAQTLAVRRWRRFAPEPAAEAAAPAEA
jgi:cellulose synthase/poly-beta-1,6-N-acetylglucosamine synthase-like glycosyltransferase